MFNYLPKVLIRLIAQFDNTDLEFVLRLLSREYLDLYTSKEMYKHILKSSHIYKKKLQDARVALSKHISIPVSEIKGEMQRRHSSISIYYLETLYAKQQREVDEIAVDLVKNGAFVINSSGDYTVFYFSCSTGNLIVQGFYANCVRLQYIFSNQRKMIRKLHLSDYEVHKGKIHMLSMHDDYMNNTYYKPLTYKEYKSLSFAFENAKEIDSDDLSLE